MDQHYLEAYQGYRCDLPDFETFAVGVLQVGQAGVNHLYEWRTSRELTWLYRGSWLHDAGKDSEQQRLEAVATLKGTSWQSLHDLQSLFVAPGVERASRRQRRGSAPHYWGCHETQRQPRLDVILPSGLEQFLMSLRKRPMRERERERLYCRI